MSVLYIALPVALFLGGGGLIACLYCIRDGQYDDLDSPSVRVLLDDQKSRRWTGIRRRLREKRRRMCLI